MVSEPGKLLKRYASEFDIQAVQAVVQVAIKVAEEYLPGEEELSEALRNLFFERVEEVIIQEEEESEGILIDGLHEIINDPSQNPRWDPPPVRMGSLLVFSA